MKKLFPAFAFILLAACTALLNRSADQCSSDSDCQPLRAGAVCSAGLCVGGIAPTDGGVLSEDSGLDAQSGFDGCFPGAPTNNEELLNACTSSQCMPFDNCARLGLCSGQGEAPSDPDGGAASSSSDAGSPATVSCFDPALRPNVVYVTGSTNFEPFLKAVAPLLAQNSPPYTIVWQVSNSCSGVNTVFNADPNKRLLKEGPGKLTVWMWVNPTSTRSRANKS
jgi:hypothetical protein